MKTLLTILIVMSGAWAFVSCSEEPLPAMTAPPVSRLMMVHSAPGLPAAQSVELYTADVVFGNNNRKANLAFGASASTNPASGDVHVKARLGTAETPFVTGTYNAEDYTHYTALVMNTESGNVAADAPVGLALLKDDLTPPGESNANVRVIHLGVGASSVDVYFFITGTDQPEPLAPGVAYATSFPGNVALDAPANGVSQPVAADFLSVPAGAYTVRLRAAGAAADATPVLSGSATLAAGRTYTLIVRGYLVPPEGVTGRNLSLQSVLHERTVY